MLFDQTLKNINRFSEIVQVLLKYGFEDLVANTPLKNLVSTNMRSSWKRAEKSVLEYTRWERTRMVCQELGPTFIKGAQLLVNRPDILPLELVKEFHKFESGGTSVKVDNVREIIEQELGQSIEDVFADFNNRPYEAASLGEVHRARLKDWTEVVVKVQHGGIQEVIQTDLAIIKEIARLGTNYFTEYGIRNPVEVVNSFEKGLQKEFDYTIEAKNVTQFQNFYANDNRFYIPAVFKNLSSDKILVLELVKGCKAIDTAQLRAWDLSPEKIARQILDIYLSQIFEHGLFHADPHPSNILIKQDGTICLIDFGVVGKLLKRDKFAFTSLFMYMYQQNARGMLSSLRKLALEDEVEDMRALQYDLNELIQDFALLDGNSIRFIDLVNRLQKIIYNYKLHVPQPIFDTFRTLVSIERICKELDPSLNLFNAAKPYGIKLLKDRFSIRNIGIDALGTTSDFLNFLHSFPIEVKDILKQLRKGKLHIQYELVEIEPILVKLDKAANKLIITLLIVALILGSSIMTTANFSPVLMAGGGISYPSLAGFILAFLLSIWLLIKTIRKK